MNKQLIISVSREFGSGGHVIADQLAKRFNLPLYDNNLLQEIAEKKNLAAEGLEKYDEVPKNKFFSRKVMGFSNSPEENIANIQFDYMRKKADEGESFVIVGRCSEEILRDYNGVVAIFILGNAECKTKRIMEKYNLGKSDAQALMHKKDRKRRLYHNYYCKTKWGDSRNYDLSVNSSKLGIDKTVDILVDYINECVNLSD